MAIYQQRSLSAVFRTLFSFCLILGFVSFLGAQPPILSVVSERVAILDCDLELSIQEMNHFCEGTEVCLKIEGGTPPYTMTLNGNPPGPSPEASLIVCFQELQPGSYIFKVTDAQNCEAKLEFEVPVIDYYLNATVKNVTCPGGHNGAIFLNIPIDIWPIYFSWEGPDGFTADTEYIQHLEAGVYSVSVTTNNEHCLGVGSWEVTQPDPIQIQVIQTVPNCGLTDICAIVSGGTAPYSAWLLQNVPTTNTDPTGTINPEDVLNAEPLITGPNQSFCFHDLSPGTYYILVVDANHCYRWKQVVIQGAPGFEVSLEINHISCHGANDGSICFSIQGGTPPYFTTLGPSTTDTGIPGPEGCFENLAGGNYVLTVTDGAGCSRSRTLHIYEPQPLEAEFEITNIDCEGNVDGCLYIHGGSVPYHIWVWTWTDPTSDVLPDVSLDTGVTPIVEGESLVDGFEFNAVSVAPHVRCAQNIPPGYYLVLVLDAHHCWTLLPVYIPDYDGLQAEFEITNQSCDQVDGCLYVQGGNPPFQIFVWTYQSVLPVIPQVEFSDDGHPYIEGAVPADIDFAPPTHDPPIYVRCAEDIPPGSYLVLVVDTEGCYVLLPVFIPYPLQVELDYDPYGTYACADPWGGQPPYTYIWYDLNQNVSISTEDCVYELEEGAYMVQVTDADACTAEAILFVDPQVCSGGEASVTPGLIFSGQSTLFKLHEYFGESIQWQFKTDYTGWLNILGATGPTYQTPPINTGSNKVILVRARVTCEDGNYLFSTIAELKVLANNVLTPLAAKVEDPELFNPQFRAKELKALNERNSHFGQFAKVYPTVATDQIFLEIRQQIEEEAVLTIFDELGQPVYTQKLFNVDAGTKLEIPLFDFQQGSYFMQLRTKSYVHSSPIFIMR